MHEAAFAAMPPLIYGEEFFRPSLEPQLFVCARGTKSQWLDVMHNHINPVERDMLLAHLKSVGAMHIRHPHVYVRDLRTSGFFQCHAKL